jgi:quercetin dioxygenase-like cupin family protein
MKTMRLVVLLLLAACAAAPPVQTPAARAVDAVESIPANYRVLFENELVKAVEHRLPAGAAEPMHSHPYPRVLYALTDSRVRVGGGAVSTMRAGEAGYREPQVHAIQNAGNSESRLIMVELKKPQPERMYIPQTDDSTAVAPHVYRVLFENERVRMLESRTAPGTATAMHSHPGLVFGYRILPSRSRITFPDGNSVEVDSQPGPFWIDSPSRHSVQNIGSTDSHTLLVEVK